VGNLVGGQNGFSVAVGQRDSQDAIAVVIINNEGVIVAREGLDNKFASEVHVGLTSGFHHRGKAQMCPVACCKARGKGIITRSGWIEDWDRTRWWVLFGGAHILMGLVKVALDGGNGTGGCCWRVCNVNPANSGMWPRQRASSRVDRDGLKRAP